jgi:hypothetical protein
MLALSNCSNEQGTSYLTTESFFFCNLVLATAEKVGGHLC